MTGYTAWHIWLLIPLWVLRMIVSLNHLTYGLVALSFGLEQPRMIDLPSHLFTLCQGVCLALESIEMSRFKVRTLDPRFYLLTQTFKSVIYTLDLLYEMWVREPDELLNGSRHSLDITIFYVSFLYALYVFVRQQTMRRTIFTRWQDSASNRSQESYPASEIGLPPHPINSSQSVRTDSMIVVQALEWLNLDDRRSQDQRSLLHTCFFWTCLPMKYAICYFVCLFVLPFSPRFPGEPHHPKLTYPYPLFHEWDYLKQDMRREGVDDNVDTATSTRQCQEEDPIIDNINLQSVPRQNRPLEANGVNEILPDTSSSSLLRPRYLCFLSEVCSGETESGYAVERVDDWLMQDRSRTSIDYVFISYTRQQFNTQLEFDSVNIEDKHAVGQDRATLADFAIRAARTANVSAFWIDFECVRSNNNANDGDDMEDMYRICDVVRASHSMVIVLGPSLGRDHHYSSSDPSYQNRCLHEWGQRAWAVPEALLCPSERRIAIYTIGSTDPEFVAKRNLPGHVWNDVGAIRQLVNHYESSIHLTRLELVTVALGCLQPCLTDSRNNDDIAYVLMGLLRMNASVTKLDSQFQAFAKLSLANDSDKILERMMCLRNPSLSWNDLQDMWDAKIWHINPLYQIANVGQDDTVLIHDAMGTAIDWQSLKLVDFKLVPAPSTFSWRLYRYSCLYFFIFALTYLYVGYQLAPALSFFYDNSEITTEIRGNMWTYTVVVCSIGAIASIPTPYMMSRHFRHKFSDTQARLFGLQGKPDLKAIEPHIFGSSCGRLRWNPESAGNGTEGDSRAEYTLIDTSSCTATLFQASKPPAMAFAGARDGGLLRTILCSYDESRNAFVKETVVRMQGGMLKRLPHLDGFNLAVSSASASYTDKDDV